jgi:hypothetical protein
MYNMANLHAAGGDISDNKLRACGVSELLIRVGFSVSVIHVHSQLGQVVMFLFVNRTTAFDEELIPVETNTRNSRLAGTDMAATITRGMWILACYLVRVS